MSSEGKVEGARRFRSCFHATNKAWKKQWKTCPVFGSPNVSKCVRKVFKKFVWNKMFGWKRGSRRKVRLPTVFVVAQITQWSWQRLELFYKLKIRDELVAFMKFIVAHGTKTDKKCLQLTTDSRSQQFKSILLSDLTIARHCLGWCHTSWPLKRLHKPLNWGVPSS